MTERVRTVTFKGAPLTLVGNEVKVGDRAPDAVLVNQSHETVRLSDYAGKVILLNVVLSLATGICSAQTKRLNEAMANLPDSVQIITVSMDLPFVQERFCGEAGIERIDVLSDHRDAAFGKAYGTLVKETRWDSRAIFVIDRNGIVQYVEYLPEIASHPDYEAALAAVQAMAG